MVFRNTLFRRQVAKHRALVLIVSAHTTKTFGNVLMSRGNLLFQQRLKGGCRQDCLPHKIGRTSAALHYDVSSEALSASAAASGPAALASSIKRSASPTLARGTFTSKPKDGSIELRTRMDGMPFDSRTP